MDSDTPACFVWFNFKVDTMLPQRTKTPTPAPAEFAKASAIAPRFGVVPNTLLKWHHTGQLPTVRVLKIGKRILFNRSDVDALVAGSAA